METLLQDVRYNFRLMLKRPGFTAAVVLTLALGIGANTAIFSVVNAVLLRPLPYGEPDRLLTVWETMPGNDRRYVAPGNFADWRAQAQSFAQLAAYADAGFNLSGDGEPERLTGAAVTPNLFDTLGVRPLVGRAFSPEDVSREEGRVAVLSYALWQSRFGASRDVVGRSVTLDEKSYTVVGVMPQGFRFPARAELWVMGSEGAPVPPSLAAQSRGASPARSRDIHISYVVGRLKPGVAAAQAQAELSAVAQRLAAQYPETNEGLGVSLVPLHKQIVGDVEPTLLVLSAAVALVLLIACTNVANFLLARVAQRERELSIRVAIGASRARLLRQMLTERLMMSLAGGLLGLLVATWCVALFVRLSPGDIPRLEEVGLDARLLVFTLLVSLATGVAFGLLPALHATKLDPQHALKEGAAKTGGGRGRRRARNLLAVSEIALAQVLLVGAGLLLTSFARLQSVEPGFDPRHLLTARLALPAAKYRTPGEQVAFYDRALERAGALAGVRSAALVMNLPLSGANMNRGFSVEGRPPSRPDENVSVDYQVVSPNYFQTLSVPLLRGRAFTDEDSAGKPNVAIINDAMARKYFPGEDPLG
ncbi:MAG: ABC transporter permease, partial [Pyrinomonadaceae bacterium]